MLATRDVTPLSYRRDGAVSAALEQAGRRLLLRPGLLLAEPETMLTASGTPYGVFTPFWRALQAAPRRTLLAAPVQVPTPPHVLSAIGARGARPGQAPAAARGPAHAG